MALITAPSVVIAHAPLRHWPSLIVIAAVTFNAGLAIVNAHVRPLGPAPVIGAELALIALAHGIALLHFRREMRPWYLLAAIMLMFALVRAAVTGEMEAKYFRDVLIIPTFIVLGMTFDARRIAGAVLAIHTLVISVALFELVFPSLYSELFRIQDYYVATRGYDPKQFWNTSSDLFVNAERPEQRLFSFLDLHRLSSLFLEPVSFGNYCIVVFAYAFAVGPRVGRFGWWFLVLGAGGGILATDGRLAAATSVAIVGLSWLAPRLPRGTAVLYLPAVTIGTVLVAHAIGFAPGSDDLAGRVANTVALLGVYDLPEFLGLSDRYATHTVDSGLGYLISTQSIFGLTLIYCFIVGLANDDTRAQRRFVHFVCIYLTFAMLVSYAFLSIKTASLLWFLYGALTRPATQPHAMAHKRLSLTSLPR